MLEPHRSDDVLPVPGSLVERALLTGAADVTVLALDRLPLPALGPWRLGLGGGQARQLSAGALGLTLFQRAHLLVEWLALAVALALAWPAFFNRLDPVALGWERLLGQVPPSS